MKHTIFKSSDSNVSKFVFESDEESNLKAIAVESVLYRYGSYKERTVVCCSTQCGCPVGCTFCGTGKFFVRNLTIGEIVDQVFTVLKYIDCNSSEIKKFQIMFMSMGEPLMNFKEVSEAIRILNSMYPNAQLLISTSAPFRASINSLSDLIGVSNDISKVGLQFSIHESNDEDRSILIPNWTSTLRQIACIGELWASYTGRKPFFNYCVHENNSSNKNVQELLANFNPNVWECTLSVICEKDNSIQNAINEKLELIKTFSNKMIKAGYSIRIFNPAGQDDIGGGCGQLWYFQEWVKNNK